MQPLFLRASTLSLRMVLLGLLSLAIMTLDHRYNQLEKVRSTLSGALYPLQVVVNLPADLAGWANRSLATHRRLVEDNEALRRRQVENAARLQRLDALEQENQRLRELLRASSRVRDRVLVSELLAIDLDPYRQQVVIDKGEHHGVYNGQPLIDAYGVMGQIIYVAPFTATALLITDPSHTLPVQLNRTGLRTIAAGTGEPHRLELRFIPTNADIAVGDEVSTSGLGGRFPADYPVARITEIEYPPGEAFARVIARPTGRIDRSREVLLVWQGEQQLGPIGARATAPSADDASTVGAGQPAAATDRGPDPAVH